MPHYRQRPPHVDARMLARMTAQRLLAEQTWEARHPGLVAAGGAVVAALLLAGVLLAWAVLA
jgi:hypothetical protein